MFNIAGLNTARQYSAIFLGFMLTVLPVPQALSAVDEDASRFFEGVPAEIIAKYSPTGDLPSDFTVQMFTPRPRPAPKEVFSIITGATLRGQVRSVVEFRVVDEFGFGIEGFEQGENVQFSFTVNKLIPGRNGLTDSWRTYMRVADEGVPLASAGTYDQGTLEDLGDGNYRFTFADGLTNISGMSYNPILTHRVGMEVRDVELFGVSVPGRDTTFDIQPSTGLTTGIRQRKIITQQACLSCHSDEEFAFHGGARRDVDQCVSCHQPFRTDIGTGNTIDFTVMIHKIHTGNGLTQPFALCGFGCENFGAPPTNFTNVTHPQDTRNCRTCHDPDNPETPQADNISNAPTAAACASCHDDLATDRLGLTNANSNHIGLAQPNETCAACHSDEGLLTGALDIHVIDSQVAAETFQYNILGVSNAGVGQSPVVTFSVTNPSDNDRPYDIAGDPPFTGSGTRLAMSFAWPNTDFSNVSNNFGTDITGRPVGQPISITLANGSGVLPQGVFDNLDGTYTVDTMALSNPLVIPNTDPPLGSGTVVIEGHPAADFNRDGNYTETVPVTDATLAFAITDGAPQPRRQVVEVEKCQNCHSINDGLAIHGNNRSDNPEACAACHNPNATDLFRRPVDPDGTFNGENLAAADTLEDRTVDFKYMIHAIHAADIREEPYYVYGFGSNVFDFSEVTYPRSSADCLACHAEGTYELPLEGGRLATTVSSSATVSAGSLFGASEYAPDNFAPFDPTDDNNFSAEAAACVACHDSEPAVTHMASRSDSGFSFGNAFLLNPDPVNNPDTQALIEMSPRENCAFCHSEDSFVPVSEAHGLRN
ncbi:MAG: OmcA/MtrC family decaheme c-type cytochrome [Xanthomonadaceae bacterium]|nr:OmcA/MtrC family decaheme c-type cytochrome [Xanthomonadaceae bacterium]